jgi:5-methylcytosine-specific restriction endonuclease McrA
MATKPRNYAEEYKKYQGTPEQLKNQSTRHKARRAYEKAHGGLPDNVDVDHIVPLSKGGASKAISNLRAASQAANRSFSRNANNSLKSQTSKREAKK